MHAKTIRFYCILIKAYFYLEKYTEWNYIFEIATDTLFHHLGPFHPLHITVNGIIANLMVTKRKMDEAL